MVQVCSPHAMLMYVPNPHALHSFLASVELLPSVGVTLAFLTPFPLVLQDEDVGASFPNL